MKILKEILYWTWCLPQTLIGLVFKWVTKSYKIGFIEEDKTYYYYFFKNGGGISLGKYVFVYDSPNIESLKKGLHHELGHQKQSLILGPLYLLVIGLPSIIWCRCFGDYRKKNKVSYYSFYPEKWADKLGGVKR